MTTRLYGIMIDCSDEKSLEQSSKFWSAALNLEITNPNENDSNKYALLEDIGNLHIEVQRVNHRSGVHLDIGTDDFYSDMNKLIKLGAKLIDRCFDDWAVMESPTGQKFCLIPTKGK